MNTQHLQHKRERTSAKVGRDRLLCGHSEHEGLLVVGGWGDQNGFTEELGLES